MSVLSHWMAPVRVGRQKRFRRILRATTPELSFSVLFREHDCTVGEQCEAPRKILVPPRPVCYSTLPPADIRYRTTRQYGAGMMQHHNQSAQLAVDHWNRTPLFCSEEERYSVYTWLYEAAEFRHHRGERVLEIGCGAGCDLLQVA